MALLLVCGVIFYSCSESKNADSAVLKPGHTEYESTVDIETNLSSSRNPKIGQSPVEKGYYDGTFEIKDKEYLINGDTLIYKSVYSSQNYGTFYHIYCWPEVYEKNNEKYLKSLKFKLVNYKGPINLGFPQSGNEKYELDYKDGVLGVKLLVQGLNKSNTLEFDVSKKNIKKGDLVRFNIRRVLVPLAYGTVNSTSEFTPNGFFDSEFFTRSGIESPRRRKPEPGQMGYPSDSLNGYTMNKLLSFKRVYKIQAEGRNCYENTMTIAWE